VEVVPYFMYNFMIHVWYFSSTDLIFTKPVCTKFNELIVIFKTEEFCIHFCFSFLTWIEPSSTKQKISNEKKEKIMKLLGKNQEKKGTFLDEIFRSKQKMCVCLEEEGGGLQRACRFLLVWVGAIMIVSSRGVRGLKMLGVC
jgi:hypothetical protein